MPCRAPRGRRAAAGALRRNHTPHETRDHLLSWALLIGLFVVGFGLSNLGLESLNVWQSCLPLCGRLAGGLDQRQRVRDGGIGWQRCLRTCDTEVFGLMGICFLRTRLYWALRG